MPYGLDVASGRWLVDPDRAAGLTVQDRLAALGAAALTFGMAGSGQAQEEQNYLLATASTGGTYYPVGVALATLAKVKLQPSNKINVSAINSAGSGDGRHPIECRATPPWSGRAKPALHRAGQASSDANCVVNRTLLRLEARFCKSIDPPASARREISARGVCTSEICFGEHQCLRRNLRREGV